MDLGNKFDLDAARKHADTGGLMNTTKWLHAALDEIERLQDLIDKPTWEMTNERIEAIKHAGKCLGFFDVFRAMLEEAEQR